MRNLTLKDLDEIIDKAPFADAINDNMGIMNSSNLEQIELGKMTNKLSIIDSFVKQQLENKKSQSSSTKTFSYGSQYVSPSNEGDNDNSLGMSSTAALATLGLVATQFKPIKDAIGKAVDQLGEVKDFVGTAIGYINEFLTFFTGSMESASGSTTEEKEYTFSDYSSVGKVGPLALKSTTQTSKTQTQQYRPKPFSRSTVAKPKPASIAPKSNPWLKPTKNPLPIKPPRVAKPTTPAPVLTPQKPVAIKPKSSNPWMPVLIGKPTGWPVIPKTTPKPQTQTDDIPKGDIVALGKWLQKQGLIVGENPAFGGVEPVHATNSKHYSGQAIDVNAPGGIVEANDPLYGAKFDDLAKRLEAAGYSVIWRAKGHQNHMHIQVGGASRIGANGSGDNEGLLGSEGRVALTLESLKDFLKTMKDSGSLSKLFGGVYSPPKKILSKVLQDENIETTVKRVKSKEPKPEVKGKIPVVRKEKDGRVITLPSLDDSAVIPYYLNRFDLV